MAALVKLDIQPGTSTGANYINPADVTAVDLYNSGLLMSLTEAEFADVDSLGYVTGVTSNFPVSGSATLQTMAPFSTARAPVKYATTDGKFGIRAGFDYLGVANATHATLKGANMNVPTGAWMVSLLATWTVVNGGYLWAVNDATLRFGPQVVTGGAIRFQQDITANTFAASSAGVVDGALHLWTFEWDGTSLTGYKDGTVVLTSSTALAAATDRLFRTWSNNKGATDATDGGAGIGGGSWEFVAIGRPHASNRALVKAKALSYHPSMTIA
jgi:hypothetical protein